MKENQELRNRCRVLEGRLSHAEREIRDLKEESLMQQTRSMRDNIQFFNIPEPEGSENCEQTIRTFLHEETKVQKTDLQKISFERIHRTGRRIQNRNRTTVAKFYPDGRQIVSNHVKNLDKSKLYGISKQLPRELAER